MAPRTRKSISLARFPPEILVEIFTYLTYSQIQQLRLICKSFNYVGRYLQCKGMHRLRTMTNELVQKNIIKKSKCEYDIRRIDSMMSLAGLIEVADAESFNFIQAGVLPPFPGELLDIIIKAIHLTSNVDTSNTAVGCIKLCKIVAYLERYWREAYISYANPRISSPINDVLILNTLLDLMECLTQNGPQVEITEYGLLVSCRSKHILPLPSPLIKDLDPYTVELGLRWQKDKTFGLHLFKYLDLGQPQDLGWFEVDTMKFHIACDPPERTPTLEDIRNLVFNGFLMIVSRSSEGEGSMPPMVVSVCVAMSLICPDALKNFRCTAL